MTATEYKLIPIGCVDSDEAGFFLKIDEAYRSALRELDRFSHVTILWWCHLADNAESRKRTECPQPYKNSPSPVGVFATRSPERPNPVGLTTAYIISVDMEGGVIRIPFIDAEVGTPIIDLKPYHPSLDRIRDVRMPEWCGHWPMWQEDSAEFDWESEFINAK